MQNTQPLVVAKHHEHVVVPGVPRNVPSTVTQHDPPHHPPMVLLASHHNITPGVPRIVAVPPPQPPHGQPPFLYHPMAHHDGHPRLEETRSAEDHVALRRKQFLPTPLQGKKNLLIWSPPQIYTNITQKSDKVFKQNLFTVLIWHFEALKNLFQLPTPLLCRRVNNIQRQLNYSLSQNTGHLVFVTQK